MMMKFVKLFGILYGNKSKLYVGMFYVVCRVSLCVSLVL